MLLITIAVGGVLSAMLSKLFINLNDPKLFIDMNNPARMA